MFPSNAEGPCAFLILFCPISRVGRRAGVCRGRLDRPYVTIQLAGAFFLRRRFVIPGDVIMARYLLSFLAQIHRSGSGRKGAKKARQGRHDYKSWLCSAKLICAQIRSE